MKVPAHATLALRRRARAAYPGNTALQRKWLASIKTLTCETKHGWILYPRQWWHGEPVAPRKAA